mmetsp:Transcript_8771/g.20281  ORF Transcript_8771/g.20281 Transcript_8771/m.20281 type:complete len:235 (-) Transcript_8771:90-794(-)
MIVHGNVKEIVAPKHVGGVLVVGCPRQSVAVDGSLGISRIEGIAAGDPSGCGSTGHVDVTHVRVVTGIGVLALLVVGSRAIAIAIAVPGLAILYPAAHGAVERAIFKVGQWKLAFVVALCSWPLKDGCLGSSFNQFDADTGVQTEDVDWGTNLIDSLQTLVVERSTVKVGLYERLRHAGNIHKVKAIIHHFGINCFGTKICNVFLERIVRSVGWVKMRDVDLGLLFDSATVARS